MHYLYNPMILLKKRTQETVNVSIVENLKNIKHFGLVLVIVFTKGSEL